MRAKLISLLFFLGVLTSVSGDDDEFVVAGYLPDYRFYIDLNSTVLGLTDLILFSVDVDFNCCLQDDHFRMVTEAKVHRSQLLPHKPELKVWLTVGGAGRSNGFLSMFANDSRRRSFLVNLADFATNHKLDGIDFDCEVPFRYLEESYQKYLEFLYHAVKFLHTQNLLVSVALHPRQGLPKEIEIDRIHLMTYDMIDPRRRGQHHAHLDQARAAAELLAHYQPKGSIVLGLPAYGRHKNNPGAVKTIAEIVDAQDGWIDDEQNDHEGMLYDSPRDVREKVDYARAASLAGVFVWEIGQDKMMPSAPLGVVVEAIYGKHFHKQHHQEEL
jgi:chitinase